MSYFCCIYDKLARLGVGTTRSEDVAKDFIFQNVLLGADVETKMKGKVDQVRDTLTVSALMRAQKNLMGRNTEKLTVWS